MPIKVTCVCGKVTNVPDAYAGRTGKCPACGKPVRVPVPQVAAVAAPAAAPSAPTPVAPAAPQRPAPIAPAVSAPPARVAAESAPPQHKPFEHKHVAEAHPHASIAPAPAVAAPPVAPPVVHSHDDEDEESYGQSTAEPAQQASTPEPIPSYLIPPEPAAEESADEPGGESEYEPAAAAEATEPAAEGENPTEEAEPAIPERPAYTRSLLDTTEVRAIPEPPVSAPLDSINLPTAVPENLHHPNGWPLNLIISTEGAQVFTHFDATPILDRFVEVFATELKDDFDVRLGHGPRDENTPVAFVHLIRINQGIWLRRLLLPVIGNFLGGATVVELFGHVQMPGMKPVPFKFKHQCAVGILRSPLTLLKMDAEAIAKKVAAKVVKIRK